MSVASNVVAGAVGTFHSLFVTTDGTLWAMGWNYEGQLGNGMYTAYHIPNPTPISVASNVVAVAAGEDFSLFVTTDGTLWAMGDNDCGQLGNGTFSTTNLPVSVTSNVVTVAVGEAHSLFVKTDGTLWAMGLNNYGQLGSSANVGTDNPNNTPISVASNVVAVAGGHWHSLFVTSDGRLWAMGDNEYGQLGNSTYTTAPNPTPVSVASNVVAVAAGMVYSLFVKMDGTLWAMGVNDYGQLGNGTTLNASTPVNVAHLFVANIFPADQLNTSLAIGIDYNAIVTLGNLNQIYTGSAINVTATTTPPGLTVILTYNGSPNAPTNPGSYTVIGTISDPNYYGSATNTLIVGVPPQNFTAGSTNNVNGQQLTLQLTGTPYYPYILQWATNLTPPIVWKPILTNPADVNGNWSWTLTNLPALPAGFYRAAGQ